MFFEHCVWYCVRDWGKKRIKKKNINYYYLLGIMKRAGNVLFTR